LGSVASAPWKNSDGKWLLAGCESIVFLEDVTVLSIDGAKLPAVKAPVLHAIEESTHLLVDRELDLPSPLYLNLAFDGLLDISK
jgi:hypothetical protein